MLGTEENIFKAGELEAEDVCMLVSDSRATSLARLDSTSVVEGRLSVWLCSEDEVWTARRSTIWQQRKFSAYILTECNSCTSYHIRTKPENNQNHVI